VADRDVVFDDCGLPWLPGRRLKGLLRDAYSELVSALPADQFGLPGVKQLFGDIGLREPGDIEIRNGYLRAYEELRAWASDLCGSDSGAGQSAIIMDSFCEVRGQTAMDRNTGSPKKDTLRKTRALHAGLVFEAVVEMGPKLSNRWAIALAAAALRQMGSSRWRGLGRVKCELIEWHASGEPSDWTKAALQGLYEDRFEAVPPASDPPPAASSHGHDTVASAILAYAIGLKEPAIFPVLAGDPNTVTTATYVPGSVIHGWFARRHGQFASNEFRRLFTSGKVRFLNAHPVVHGKRAQPVPHSIRERKENRDRLVDLSVLPEAEKLRRARGWCDASKLAESNFEEVKPETGLHYHHARAQNPLYQRALGEEEAQELGVEPERRGAFFQYLSLSAGQTFQGEIHGPPEDLELIGKLAPSGTHLRLGRSRSAQYGGSAVLRWQTPSAQPTTCKGPVTQFRVVARSAVLGYNSCGNPAPQFPIAELERELNCFLQLRKEFARTSWEGGYLAHLQLPRPQQPAWAAGSVLVLEPKDGTTIDPVRFELAKRRAYGLRREQGYGEVDLLEQSPHGNINRLRDDDERPASAAQEKTRVYELALQIFHSVVRQESRRAAGDLAVKGKLPAKALLHRLLSMLEAQTEEAFRLSISKLRDRARDQLEKCRLPKAKPLVPENTTLDAFLVESRDLRAEGLVDRLWGRTPWRSVFRERPAAPEGLAQLYLAEFLAALAKRAGKEKAE
jgi:CRISPR-associated protein Csx10